MSSYVNISEIADQVLASVRAEANTKTASTQAPPRTYVPMAQELRKLANDLREEGDGGDAVSEEDLALLMQDPEVMQLLEAIQNDPELMQMVLQDDGGTAGPERGGAAGGPEMDPAAMGHADTLPPPEGHAPGGPAPKKDEGGDSPFGKKEKSEKSEKPEEEKDPSDECPPDAPPAQKAAHVLKKIAAQLRADDARAANVRLIKAAHMLNAAKGLKHLTKGF